MVCELVVRAIVSTSAVTIAAAGFGWIGAVWMKARHDPGQPEYDPYEEW